MKSVNVAHKPEPRTLCVFNSVVLPPQETTATLALAHLHDDDFFLLISIF